MVAKISHGASLYGALAYNHNKVATGAAGILSGNRMISDRLGLPSEDMRLTLLSFENYLLANRNTESLISPTNMVIPTMPISILSVSVWTNKGKKSVTPTSTAVP